MALADNHTSDTSMFDFATVVEDFGIDELGDWEFELPFDDMPTDVDGFFEGADKVENKRKTMICPHCGKEIEV